MKKTLFTAVLLLGVAALLMVSFWMSEGDPESSEGHDEIPNESGQNGTEDSLGHPSNQSENQVSRFSNRNRKKENDLSLDDAENPEIERLEPGRRRVTKLSKWLTPVERAVLVHHEMVAAGVETGHSVSELNLQVSESRIMEFIERVEGLLDVEGENADLEQQVHELRNQHSINAPINATH